MKTNKKNGFTLIELIIVMVILGVMSAVAGPRYLGIATAAIIPKIIMTMINSINVNPFFLFVIIISSKRILFY